MKNLVLKVSLKYGGILAAVILVFNSIAVFTYNSNNPSQLTSAIIGILLWCSFIVCIAMAHYEFNKRNENYISFRDAFFIGLIIVGIYFVISTAFAVINFELNTKDNSEIPYSHLMSSKLILQSSFMQLLILLVLLLLLITAEAHWKIFKKAGKEGLAAFIPIYNLIVLLEIVEKPTWWIILLLIPFVNLIFAIWITNLLSKKFDKDEGFTIGLLILPVIFYPLLGLSKAEYMSENRYDIELNNDLK